MFRFARVSGQNIDWLLKRNSSVLPAQLGWIFAALCVMSLGVASLFWSLGPSYVLGFVVVEMLAVGAALRVFSRHATDGETISLRGSQLVVELKTAGRHERAEFSRDRVRVEPRAGDTSLIEVSGQGRTVKVGRFVRPDLRPMLAHEIRRALRHA